MQEQRALLIAGRADALESLAPLIAAHQQTRPVRRIVLPAARCASQVPVAALGEAAAVLFVGDRRLSPRNVLPGLFLRDGEGRPVPCGWLPDVPGRLACFAAAAAELSRRGTQKLARGPFVLLSQWDERALRVVNITANGLASLDQPPSILRWTSDRIARTDMLRALGHGPGVALYLGHARPVGWAGYHGVRAHHLGEAKGEPVGAIVSLTCHTANRWRVGLSFCEELVLQGICAASLGATRKTLFLDNGWMAKGLCEALRGEEVSTMSEWLLAARLPANKASRVYRLVGDPLATLAGAVDSPLRCREVFAPAPDDALPVLGLELLHPAAGTAPASAEQLPV